MGRYIDWADVSNRYPNFADFDGASGVNSAYVIYAEAEIDGRLATRYTTPFSTNNLTVRDLCVDLTYIKCGRLRTEDAKTLKEDLDARIARLIDGSEVMMVETGSGTTESVQRTGDTVWSNTQDYQPTFNLDSPLDWQTDSAQLAAIEDARG